jgi:hypothetical protein
MKNQCPLQIPAVNHLIKNNCLLEFDAIKIVYYFFVKKNSLEQFMLALLHTAY